MCISPTSGNALSQIGQDLNQYTAAVDQINNCFGALNNVNQDSDVDSWLKNFNAFLDGLSKELGNDPRSQALIANARSKGQTLANTVKGSINNYDDAENAQIADPVQGSDDDDGGVALDDGDGGVFGEIGEALTAAWDWITGQDQSSQPTLSAKQEQECEALQQRQTNAYNSMQSTKNSAAGQGNNFLADFLA